MVKRGLGKGLDALLTPNVYGQNDSGDAVILIGVEDIFPNSHQPRKNFDQDKMRELSLSIQEHGLVQPILVRAVQDQKYEIIAGERRWRAARLAGLTEIPCLVKDLDDRIATEVALIENIQREDLNVMEEAEAFIKLMQDFEHTQDSLGARLGKSRSYVANTLRLLNLPLPVQSFIREGIISAGHARAILSINAKEKRTLFAEKIIKEKMSVRQAEEWAKEINQREENLALKETDQNEMDDKQDTTSPGVKDMESRLRGLLSTKVRIKRGKNGGKIEIDYYSLEDLERIMTSLIPEDDF
ncbi:ParB/RepB/Spo0J family partition protein [Dehalobacterium formicoaceticum]|uniref:ParB/RepB/Spo0J family partition protein n=1 Tax=Dehalobacterium formicoaceticum TaxID=51515 RepID=A0ABT1Y430_9FIRM|nr:ParB/RepB/Spo0J family partition protein [Dehalobacterium formicoaceticum]MCR6545637.1 ParB/RepB/Spo0J family partition protein [Dehalobacterium formicoaceticum]